MSEVTVNAEFKTPAATVWMAVGDFCGIGKWLPGVQRVEAENEGKRRRVVLPDGQAVIEDEIFRDDAGMSLSYRVVQGPMPFTDYVSTISVQSTGNGCLVRWAGRFTPVGPEDKVVRLVKGIYGSALKGLHGYLGEF